MARRIRPRRARHHGISWTGASPVVRSTRKPTAARATSWRGGTGRRAEPSAAGTDLTPGRAGGEQEEWGREAPGADAPGAVRDGAVPAAGRAGEAAGVGTGGGGPPGRAVRGAGRG